MLFGCGCPSTVKYDVSKFDGVEKNKLSEVGLKSLKTDYEDAFSREILTRYYEEKKECSEKALYWALQDAEKGSDYCMAFLRWAYVNGEGVIEDQVEVSKWMHLAAAKGNEQEKKLLHIIRDMNEQGACMNPDHEEGRKRAQEWMKQHGLYRY